jgi:hypothetical protein
VSKLVLTSTLNVPTLPPRLRADWQREVSVQLQLAPGDVEQLPLARARTRWPDYRLCVQAATDWASAQGLPAVLATSEIALMACRGARYHHDADQYGGAVFCNLFVSDDLGLDLHFAATGHRIPLTRGTVVVFDTGQPHAVIPRGGQGFKAGDFPPERDCTQVFLTWELPVDNSNVARALGIEFDVDPATARGLHEGQVWVNGARASVCPSSGRWLKE